MLTSRLNYIVKLHRRLPCSPISQNFLVRRIGYNVVIGTYCKLGDIPVMTNLVIPKDYDSLSISWATGTYSACYFTEGMGVLRKSMGMVGTLLDTTLQ